jgi:hypothetical protein
MANKERKIQFASHEVGLVLDSSIWRSADSGISWRKVLEDSEFNAFEALSGQFAVAAGAQGRFAVSHDAGATWEVTRIVPAGNTIAIAASDPANIFIASDSGLLLLSTDQGRTWTEISLPSPSFVIQDLASCEAGKLWLIGRPREEAIRTEAYYLWLTRGGKAGQEKADWFEARDRLLRHSLCFTPDYGQSWTTAEVPHYEFDSLKCLGAEQVVALSPRFGCAAALFPHPTWLPSRRAGVVTPSPGMVFAMPVTHTSVASFPSPAMVGRTIARWVSSIMACLTYSSWTNCAAGRALAVSAESWSGELPTEGLTGRSSRAPWHRPSASDERLRMPLGFAPRRLALRLPCRTPGMAVDGLSETKTRL